MQGSRSWRGSVHERAPEPVESGSVRRQASFLSHEEFVVDAGQSPPVETPNRSVLYSRGELREVGGAVLDRRDGLDYTNAAAQLFDIGVFSLWIEQSVLPYAALFTLLFISNNLFSLIQLGFLFTSTASSTLHLQALVAAPSERKFFKVVDVLLIVSMNIWALSFLGLPDSMALRALKFQQPDKSLSVVQCLFQAVIASLLIKQWMIIPKVLSSLTFLCGSTAVTSARRQRRALTMLEYISLAWTDAVPVTLWVPYLLHSCGRGRPCAYACGLTGVYLAIKGRAYAQLAHNACQACSHALWGWPRYGAKITTDAVIEAGGQCPICQDPPCEPLKLRCGHIFCDSCITEWLDRERTCPMCRSTVRHDGLQSFGNGTTSLLPSIF